MCTMNGKLIDCKCSHQQIMGWKRWGEFKISSGQLKWCPPFCGDISADIASVVFRFSVCWFCVGCLHITSTEQAPINKCIPLLYAGKKYIYIFYFHIPLVVCWQCMHTKYRHQHSTHCIGFVLILCCQCGRKGGMRHCAINCEQKASRA